MIYDPSLRRQAAANPVVIITAGDLGRRVLELLPVVARDLGVRIDGQFGLAEISALSLAEEGKQTEGSRSIRYELSTSILCSVQEPDRDPQHLWSGTVRPDGNRELRAGASLLRRLCPIASGRAELRVAPETSYEIYLLIDLRDHAAVLGALRFARALSRETTHFEMTAILLTGRSSLPEQKDSEAWRLGLAEICAAHGLQSEIFGCLFHRAYLLDGMNSRRAWLDSPESLCLLAARFLLQHGFSPQRRWLRQFEKSRVTEGQPFREVLGSFAIRHVNSGIESIVEQVSAILLESAPFSGASPREDEEATEQAAREFEQQIDAMLNRKHTLAEVTHVREKVLQQLGKSIAAVARQNQVARLARLFHKLDPIILRLHSRVQAIERTRDRREGSVDLQKQVQGVDKLGKPTRVVPLVSSYRPPLCLRVPVPVPRIRWFVGLIILAVGFAFGCCLQENVLWPLIPGLFCMFMGAVVVDMPPSPWLYQRFPRACVGDKNVSTVQREFKKYRAGQRIPVLVARVLPSAGYVIGGIALITLGIALAIYSLRFDSPSIELAEILCISLGVTIAGLASLYQPVHRPGIITAAEQGDTANSLDPLPQLEAITLKTVSEFPPAYFPELWGLFGFWRPFWLIILTGCVARVLLHWEINLRDTPYPWPENLSPELAGHAVRLALLLVGVGIALLIWPAQRSFACGISVHPPEPEFNDIVAPASIGEEVDISLHNTLDWLRSLTDPLREEPLEDAGNWSPQPSRERTFLDVIDPEWPRHLAEECLPYLDVRGKLGNDWAEFIKAEIAKGPSDELRLHTLARSFTHRCVQHWLNDLIYEHDWSHLMQLLRPQSSMLRRYFDSEVAPMWPVVGAAQQLDSGAALVDERLQMAATAQEMTQQSPWRVRGMRWPRTADQQGLVILVRMVQGITEDDLTNLLMPAGE